MKRSILTVFIVMVLMLLWSSPAFADDPSGGAQANVDIPVINVEGGQYIGGTIVISGYIGLTAIGWAESGGAYADSNAMHRIAAPDGSILEEDSNFISDCGCEDEPFADASQIYLWRYVFSPQQSGYYVVSEEGMAYGYWSNGSLSGSAGDYLWEDFTIQIVDDRPSPIQVVDSNYGYLLVDLLGTHQNYEWVEAINEGVPYDYHSGSTCGKTLAKPVSVISHCNGKEYKLEMSAGTVVTCHGYKLQNLIVQYVDDELYFAPDCEFSSPVTLTITDGDTVTVTTFSTVRRGKIS